MHVKITQFTVLHFIAYFSYFQLSGCKYITDMFHVYSGSVDKAVSSGWYLQKTLPGGIMLMELQFREVFFCVSVYAYEWRPMSDGRKINAQVCTMPSLFIAACSHVCYKPESNVIFSVA